MPLLTVTLWLFMSVRHKVVSMNFQGEQESFATTSTLKLCLDKIIHAMDMPEQWTGSICPDRDTRDGSDGENPAFVRRTEY